MSIINVVSRSEFSCSKESVLTADESSDFSLAVNLKSLQSTNTVLSEIF